MTVVCGMIPFAQGLLQLVAIDLLLLLTAIWMDWFNLPRFRP